MGKHNNSLQVAFFLLLCAVASLCSTDSLSEIHSNCAIGPLAIAGIASGVNFLAQGIGSLFGSRKKKKAQREYLASVKKNNADYNRELSREIHSNYLDRADSQSAIRRIIDYNNEVSRRQQTNAIKGGASDEAKVALAAQQSRALGDTIGQIAGQGAQYKAQLRNQLATARHQQGNQLAQMKYGFASDTSAMDNMISAIGDSASLIGSAAMMGQSGGASATDTTKIIDETALKKGLQGGGMV